MAVHSLQHYEGYLRIDNRLAPPVDEAHLAQVAALEATGAYVVVPPAYSTFEAATLTCCHCHTTFIKNPQRQRARGHCGKCHRYTCDSPGCNQDCVPMKKVIDDLQELFYQQGR